LRETRDGRKPVLSLSKRPDRSDRFALGAWHVPGTEDIKVYDYRFNTKELKAPLIEAAQAAGWGWKGVAFGKL